MADSNGSQNGSTPGHGCTQAQLRRFIKSRAYVPMHELRRRFDIDGEADEVHAVDNHTEFVLWLHDVPPEHEATIWLREAYTGKSVTIVDVGANAGLFSLPILAVLGAPAAGRRVDRGDDRPAVRDDVPGGGRARGPDRQERTP